MSSEPMTSTADATSPPPMMIILWQPTVSTESTASTAPDEADGASENGDD